MTVQFADHLKDIPDYIPGKPVEELERELGIREAIKMASNENFWGPPEKVSDAIFDKIKQLNFYPDTGCFLLRNALSKKLGVQPDQITIGNGSNYLIELICRSVLNPGSEAITCPPTFAFYGRAIQGAIGKNKMIPMKNFDVDLYDVLKGVTDQTRLIILASPLYFCGVTGLMKSFLDRLYFFYHEANRHLVAGKNVVIVTTLGEKQIRFEMAPLVEFYRRYLRALRLRRIGLLTYPDLMEKDSIKKHREYLGDARAYAQRLIKGRCPVNGITRINGYYCECGPVHDSVTHILYGY